MIRSGMQRAPQIGAKPKNASKGGTTIDAPKINTVRRMFLYSFLLFAISLGYVSTSDNEKSARKCLMFLKMVNVGNSNAANPTTPHAHSGATVSRASPASANSETLLRHTTSIPMPQRTQCLTCC